MGHLELSISFIRPLITSGRSGHHIFASRKKVSGVRYIRSRRSRVMSCTEVPSWKKGPVDTDFAKDEQLEILEASLDRALKHEDFSTAVNLRDKLLRLQSSAFVAVLSCNMKFYKAFNGCSLVDMAGCWLQSSSSTCKHPGGPLLTGYVDIINSFGLLFSLDLPPIQIENCRIIMRGTVGYVTCDQICFDEDGQKIVTCATNVYIKHNSQWYLMHHSSVVVEHQPVS